MNRLLRLREFLKSDPELKEHSTQAGFGRLLGYSTSMIRHVEQKGITPSPKLARAAQRKIGVNPDWLMGLDGDDLPDPIDSSGSPLTTAAVKKRLRHPQGSYLGNMPNLQINGLKSLADTVVRAVKHAVEEDIKHEDITLIQRLLEVLGERQDRLEG